MAAESLVSFLLDKLASFVENEIPLLKGDRQEALFLRGELERMRALLKIADALEESDEELKVWLKQVREIVYETEAALDEYRLIQAHDQCHGLGLYGYLHKFSCCIKSMKARSRIISELNCINSRFKNISEVHERLLPKFTRAEQGSGITSAGNTWEYRRGDALLLDKTDLVGIDEPKQQLVEWLVKGGYGREVVSVAAMGGMGKTTLAKQVYDDPEVKKHFKRRAWITVSQTFKMEELLRDMIHQIYSVVSRPVPEGLDSMNKDRLRRIVKDLLQKRRYLIVLDDVWHLYEWDALKYAMPNNNCGSRIILTTRNADVASSSGVESVGKVYNLKPLTPEESWQLFSRKTFQGNACPSYLKEICQYTLKKCEGLPLAIVAISGVLATKDKRRTDEWNMVGRSLGAEIDGNDKLQDLKKVLSLSFNDLPFYLRSCFLYLSIFPEDYRIGQMRVIRLWIAEGFIEAKEGKTLEEVAEDYLNELLNRGLLQVAGTTTDGRVKMYRVHDLLREIIMSKARDQNFTSIAKDHNMTRPDKVRRLAIHNSLQNIQENRSVSRLRSLFIFRVVEKLYIQRLFPEGFKLLSVLDLQHLSSPPPLIQRVYLRGRLETLPHWIPSLHGLVSLSLKWSRLMDDPLVLLQKLPNLVHLELLQAFEGDTLYFRTGGFKKLKVLGLDKFSELRCMQVEAGAMPFVEKLIIQRCELLKRVPIGIEYLTNLKVLEFFDMPEEFIQTLRPVEKQSDYWKVAHIPEVYSTYWREGGWEVNPLDLGDGENFPRPGTITRRDHELQSRWK